MSDKRLVLPCLRGFIGSWVTYNCLMKFSDIANLVGFAQELHKIEKLSCKIQRELNNDRATEIADYLIENDDRFFNSIVVAVYDGDPNWHEIGKLLPNTEDARSLELPEYAEESLGFLSITKKEKFFALDGQHRLAGIKEAIKRDSGLKDELINVIIVTHSNSPKGIIRSRRLFTTLNKKAKLVSKDTIIALDEDDIAACITRRLIESDQFKYFSEDNISFSSGPVRDKTSITSIVNLYDNIQKLVCFKLGVKIQQLDSFKFKDHQFLYDFCEKIYSITFDCCNELRSVALGREEVSRYRDSLSGGHLLFRPIGWDLFIDVVIKGLDGAKNKEEYLPQLIKNIISKDLNLNGKILTNKAWSIKQRKIIPISKANKNKLMSYYLSK